MLLVPIIILRLMGLLLMCHLGVKEAKIVTVNGSSNQKYPLEVHHMFRERYMRKVAKAVGVWSTWGLWTPCSRSCGGGVTQQTRHCISQPADSRFIRRQRRRRQANGCVGLYKRMRLCNSQNCPQMSDFRHEQCAAFNHRPFKGKVHVWEPYTFSADECALNCRPLGADFYATLNRTVIDGTACGNPSTSYGRKAPKGTRGVCINGSCKSVNTNGIIGSIDTDEEECSACLKGSCRSINGLYTRPDLPPGYSLVAQIPQGACRILVQQLQHTRNFLALRNANGSFIINGDWKISGSRQVEGAGVRFNYVKSEVGALETITSSGPLANPVDIMIVNFQTNPGVKYGYSIPTHPPHAPHPLEKRLDTPADQPARPHRRPRPRRRFAWKLTGLSACSRPCGGGVQAAVAACVREHTQTAVSEKRCAHLERPQAQPLPCNAHACAAAQWEGGRWGPCSAACGGTQRMVARCVRDGELVGEGECGGRRPAGVRECGGRCGGEDNELPQDTAMVGREWVVGPWAECSTTCGSGHRTRSITCPSALCPAPTRPKSTEPCPTPTACPQPTPWLLTEWSPCSAPCGTGTQTRLAHCPNCTLPAAPETRRACASERQCAGQWYSGPWGACDACVGRQRRDVVCVVRIRGQAHITNDMTCASGVKPPLEMACGGECGARWFVGEWRGCEGCEGCEGGEGGVERRVVRCLEGDGRESGGCGEGERPVGRRGCECEGGRVEREEEREKERERERERERVMEREREGGQRVREREVEKGGNKPVQDEPQSENRFCVDRIVNCYMAVQARLCQYNYYRTHCCAACRKTPLE